MFLSRPDGSSPENRWGNNRIGKRGNDNFFHPEVIAANHFRHLMQGEPENFIYSEDRSVVGIERGNRGVALVNIGDAKDISLPTSLPEGEYVDAVHQAVFHVISGLLKGKVAKEHSYILVASN